MIIRVEYIGKENNVSLKLLRTAKDSWYWNWCHPCKVTLKQVFLVQYGKLAHWAVLYESFAMNSCAISTIFIYYITDFK
ncbi:hypothetical protein DKX38_019039 [Salix brachista]|uniref:Uncharacterized protein n=1 Tax=Salix brachista TaxID=2182728 RepID=A0A5N5KPQ8_9ROSI|nr:hypothetical protein DKX38_019039 [Salix brachista]